MALAKIARTSDVAVMLQCAGLKRWFSRARRAHIAARHPRGHVFLILAFRFWILNMHTQSSRAARGRCDNRVSMCGPKTLVFSRETHAHCHRLPPGHMFLILNGRFRSWKCLRTYSRAGRGAAPHLPCVSGRWGTAAATAASKGCRTTQPRRSMVHGQFRGRAGTAPHAAAREKRGLLPRFHCSRATSLDLPAGSTNWQTTRRSFTIARYGDD